MKNLIIALSLASSFSQGFAFDEGLKIFCNSEFVVGREAHRDYFFDIPVIREDKISIKLLSQDYVCGRKQDDKQKDVYQWLSIPNKELPYYFDVYTWSGTNTTVKPDQLAYSHLNSNDEIEFEDASEALIPMFAPGTWQKEELKLVTLTTKLKNVLGKKLAKDLLEGKVQSAKVHLVARREFHKGGERFILEVRRETNQKLYAKLYKK